MTIGQRFARLVTDVVVRRPSLWRLFHAGATGPYSLSPEAWRKIISTSER